MKDVYAFGYQGEKFQEPDQSQTTEDGEDNSAEVSNQPADDTIPDKGELTPESDGNTISDNTPGTELTDTPDSEPADAPETELTDIPETGPTDAPETGPTDAPETGPTDAPETELTDTPETGPTDAPEAEPMDAPEAESTDAPEAESTDAPETVPTGVPETEPTSAPEAEATDAPEPHEEPDIEIGNEADVLGTGISLFAAESSDTNIQNIILWGGSIAETKDSVPHKYDFEDGYYVIVMTATSEVNAVYNSFLAFEVRGSDENPDSFDGINSFAELQMIREEIAMPGDPVDLLSGSFTWNYTDFALFGQNDLEFTRYYESVRSGKNYGLGNGWTTNWT